MSWVAAQTQTEADAPAVGLEGLPAHAHCKVCLAGSFPETHTFPHRGNPTAGRADAETCAACSLAVGARPGLLIASMGRFLPAWLLSLSISLPRPTGAAWLWHDSSLTCFPTELNWQ